MSQEIWYKHQNGWEMLLEPPSWCEEEVDGDIYCKLIRLLAYMSEYVNISSSGDYEYIWFERGLDGKEES
jgi:hypothetical protein